MPIGVYPAFGRNDPDEIAHVTRVESSSRIDGEDTWRLAAAEYRRMLELLRTLGDGDWTRPTDCTAWDVRGMLGHLVGAAEGFGSPTELIHQYRVGAMLRRRGAVDGHLPVDGANAVQVSERSNASAVDLIRRYERATPKALRWRRRLWQSITRYCISARPSAQE